LALSYRKFLNNLENYRMTDSASLKRLAIVITHPIQYYAPWFKLLQSRKQIALRVFYTWSQAEDTIQDRKFGKEIRWDLPLKEGYPFEFVENRAQRPGTHHFFGIQCPQLIKSIEQYRPDAVLIFGWNFMSHLKVMRHFKGKIPVWFRGDSNLLDENQGWKTFLRRQTLRWVYSHVDKAFYVGEANKAYFEKHGLSAGQLVYAPHAIDNERFSKKQYDSQASIWRKELGYNKDDLVVLFVGKFETKKQPELLLEVVQSLNINKPNPLKLLFVGNGILEAQLKATAQNDPHIQFLPFQNQQFMPLVYRLGNVLCLPSKGPGETWGLAVNEAMASGVPVICSDKVGCHKDLIDVGKTGFIFKAREKNELRILLELLNIEQLNDMGKTAHSFIKNWSFHHIVLALEVAMNKD